MTTPPAIFAVTPSRAIEGGRLTIEGSGFPVDEPSLPEVLVGGRPARIVSASPSRLGVLVPQGLAEGGRLPVQVAGSTSDVAQVDIAATFAMGLHQVDNPLIDREGNLYVTYSGTRGQEVPISIFRVRPNGTREAFSSGIVNPTSIAIAPDGQLYVSSRFEGTVYRLAGDGSVEPFATDLGVACGLAFSPDGTLFVGDRTGTIFKVDRDGRPSAFATLPGSVAAFHLAFAPDRTLFVTAPTLTSYDHLYRVAHDGTVSTCAARFGRPQGLAFDAAGTLFVTEALAGASGVYRVDPGSDAPPELVLVGPGLVGIAFGPDGALIVSSNETVYRLSTMSSGASTPP
jgi:sugar lactone lactonase YvrE